jgi:hypothetical protein
MGDCEQSVKMPETEGTFRIASLTVSGASAGPRASTADQQEVASLEAPFTVHIKGDAGFVWCSDGASLTAPTLVRIILTRSLTRQS